MAYFIEARRELELPKLRDVTLQAISKLKYRGGNYRTKPIDPFIWDSKEGWDLYMLGRIIDRTGFTSLVANYIKDHRFCGPDFFRITEELDFLPNWVLRLGIESAHSFDAGPLHKNLHNERIFEAYLLGQKIKKEVQGVENLAFVHYEVDNVDIVPKVVRI